VQTVNWPGFRTASKPSSGAAKESVCHHFQKCAIDAGRDVDNSAQGVIAETNLGRVLVQLVTGETFKRNPSIELMWETT